jgi:hypothetical protein
LRGVLVSIGFLRPLVAALRGCGRVDRGLYVFSSLAVIGSRAQAKLPDAPVRRQQQPCRIVRGKPLPPTDEAV